MTTFAADMPAMPSIRFGSPGDWDRFFWELYHGVLMEILHSACPPDGQERYIAREQIRRGLRSA